MALHYVYFDKLNTMILFFIIHCMNVLYLAAALYISVNLLQRLCMVLDVKLSIKFCFVLFSKHSFPRVSLMH